MPLGVRSSYAAPSSPYLSGGSAASGGVAAMKEKPAGKAELFRTPSGEAGKTLNGGAERIPIS